MRRRWLIQRTNRGYVDYLSRQAGISGALSQVFINRGIKTQEAVKRFLDPGLDLLSDPFSLRGMKEAAKAIGKAKASGTPVLVHGDYDVDGVSSAAILVDSLRKFGFKEIHYFIPNRFTHGYGFHEDAVEMAARAGAGLIITADCGITAFETAALAKREGISVIITDHHEPERDPDGNPLMPEALAVIDPKVHGDEPELSGAGVAFKMAQALLGGDALQYVDLATLGTIADLVPLVGENRAIAKEGLSLMERAARPALRALKEVAGSNREMSARLLCYTLIPRLNAPGRLDDATGAVCFLLAEDQEEALSAARELDRVNKERQRIEEALYVEAKKMLDEQGFDGGAIVLCGEGWHKGILGIVASRLCDEFYRPAVVLSVANGVAKGSARSVPEFDLYGGLSELKDMLAGFGGHRQAAGLRMKTEMIDAFRGALSDMVKDRAPELVPSLRIDADVSLREVNFNLVRELAAVEPFGYGNPEPVLGAKELEVIQPRVVGNGHLKMKLRQKRSNTAVEAIGFDMARMMGHIEESYAVDAAFTPQINEWENGRTLQLNLKGLRPSVS